MKFQRRECMKKVVVCLMTVVVLLLCALFFGCEESTTTPPDVIEVSDKLDTPEIRLNDNIVSWKSVKNADYYVVFTNGVWQQVVHGNQYELDDRVNGEYEVRIYACDSYKNYKSSDFSNSVTYVVDKLELKEPELSLDGEKLSWNDVPGATAYDLYVNGIRESECVTTVADGVHTCQLNFSVGGTYKIFIKAVSIDENYEKESSSNEVVYRFSTDKRWYASDIRAGWEMYGRASLYMKWIYLKNADEGETTGLTNRIFVDENHSYLYLFFDQMVGDTGELSPEQVIVKVNNVEISAVTYDRSANIPDNVFVYNLSSFVNQIVDITVELNSDTTMALSQIKLFTKNNISTLYYWDPTCIEQEWISEGKVVQHMEGFCLECENGNPASITNRVHIGNQKNLVISFRKFLRIGSQDSDPKVYVYVNGVLVIPQNGDDDYATVSTEAYTAFTYDLSAYVGQDVDIRVVSEEGEHACFSFIKLIN